MMFGNNVMRFMGVDLDENEDETVADLVKKGKVDAESGVLLGGLLGLEEPLAMPVDPGKDFGSYMAEQDGFKGFIGAIADPRVARAFYGDDYTTYKDKKAQYLTDKSLFDVQQAARIKRAENSAGDAQDEALAKYYRDLGFEELALQIESGGLSAIDLNPKVVGTGQDLVSPVTNSVEFAGRERDDRTTLERDTGYMANLLGIENDPALMAELGGIIMDPAQTTTLADGTVRHDNAFAPFLERLQASQDAAAVGQQAGVTPGQSPQGGPAVPGLSASGVTPDGAQDAAIRKAVNEKEAGEVAGSQDELDFWGQVGGVLDDLGTFKKGQTSADDRFIANDALKSIYGPLDSWYPDGARGGDEQDAIAQINRLNALLSVDAREQLAGQGQITEGEQAMLGASLSALLRERDGMKFGGGISDKLVEKELGRIYAIMERSRERAQKRSQKAGGSSSSTDIDSLVNLYAPKTTGQ